MIRRLALLTGLLVIPSIAMSQRGGGGRTQADRRTEMFDKNDKPSGPAIRVRDLEDLSPLKLIIDKRKDLKLTDAQLNSLKDAENKLKDKNAPLLKAADSLIHEMRVAAGGSTETDRSKGRSAQNGLMSVIDDVRTNYDSAGKDAIATLDAEQQTKATEMLAKQREEGEKTVRERMRPSGGNQSPGGPPTA
jgi:hypothetical protein